MTGPGIHDEPDRILRNAEMAAQMVQAALINDGLHPTNAVAILLASLCRELGRQARHTGRMPHALALMDELKRLVDLPEGDPAATDRLARALNHQVLKLVGVSPQ